MITTSVEILESIREVAQPEWDALVGSCRAPVFYSYDFLSAYERNPLQNADRFLYLVSRENGRLHSALPVQVQSKPDPLGVMRQIRMQITDQAPKDQERALLTHVLHCYDTRVLTAHVTEEIVVRTLEGLEELAREWGAVSLGFLNVDGRQDLFRHLVANGFSAAPTDSRFRLDLERPSSLELHLATLKKKFRHEVQRSVRRASDAKTRIVVSNPTEDDLGRVIDLFRHTAARHDSADYYPADKLAGFLSELADRITLVAVYLGEDLVGAATCLRDERRFHLWAGGARYDLSSFSTYYVLFHEALRAAYASGASWAEGGRGNTRFKEKFGMEAVPLFACFRRVR